MGMTKRLFILGATGRIGTHLVELGAARGHALTVFVRSPDKLIARPPGLQVVSGDPLDVAQLAAALPGHDAVLSALGPSTREAFRASTLMTRAASSTVAAMASAGVSRLAIASAAVLFPEPGVFFAFARWALRQHARDLTGMERVVRASGLDWTIARPPRLVQRHELRYSSRTEALPERSRVMSFGAVAAFLLDCVEQHTHPCQIVGLGPVAS
jgi:putative NADH-flavin reductase